MSGDPPSFKLSRDPHLNYSTFDVGDVKILKVGWTWTFQMAGDPFLGWGRGGSLVSKRHQNLKTCHTPNSRAKHFVSGDCKQNPAQLPPIDFSVCDSCFAKWELCTCCFVSLTTLSHNVQVFARVEDFVCNSFKELRCAFSADCVMSLPVVIIVLFLKFFFLKSTVFLHKKLKQGNDCQNVTAPTTRASVGEPHQSAAPRLEKVTPAKHSPVRKASKVSFSQADVKVTI